MLHLTAIKGDPAGRPTYASWEGGLGGGQG
jgi:hypothetical protein